MAWLSLPAIRLYGNTLRKTDNYLETLYSEILRCRNIIMKYFIIVLQAAMNLYKLFSKNPYYFWAVMSIVMQVLVILVLPIICIQTTLDHSEYFKKKNFCNAFSC